MSGVCFLGKSTLALKIAVHRNAALVSQDDIWFANKERWNLDMDSAEDWERIQQLSKAEIRQKLAEGFSVVYDDIGRKHTDRDSLRTLARESGAHAVTIYLNTPRGVQQERQATNLETQERRDVPEHIIAWGLSEFEASAEAESPFIFTPETDLAEWFRASP